MEAGKKSEQCLSSFPQDWDNRTKGNRRASLKIVYYTSPNCRQSNPSKGKEQVYAASHGHFGRMQGLRVDNGKLAFQWDVKEQGEAKIVAISASKGKWHISMISNISL